MKLSPSIKGLLIALLCTLGAFAIYFLFLAKRNYYVLDNPTSTSYYYSINGSNEGIIAPGQTLNVDLKMGKNTIKVMDEQKKLLYDSAFEVSKIRGLLNVAHQDYYIHTQYYGYDLDKDSLLKSQKVVTIDGKEYFGEPKKMNKLYSEDFYYNIDEDYDKIIKNIDKVETRTKIFRKQDFKDYYNEYYKF